MSTSRVLALLPLGLIVVACSSTSSGGGTGTTEETKPAEPAPVATTPEAPAAPAPTTPPKKDPPAPAGECSSEATQAACVQCCSSKHEDGAAVYFVALIDCMCAADLCAKDCEHTLCDPDNPQNADSTCQACVQAKSGKCSTPIKTACQADADCVAFDACAGQSDCPGKPN